MTMMVETHQSQLPMTTTQLAGHGITTVVGGLTPPMLGILLLICAGLAASTYFLNILIKGQQLHLGALLNLQERQISLVLKTHDREFDALMAMVKEQLKEPLPPPVDDGIPLPLPRP